MTNSEERVERRKQKRLRVQENAYVILKPCTVGPLIDISMDGLTFEYVDIKEPSKIQSELDIAMTNSAFSLRNVPCKILSDFEVLDVPSNPLSVRQCRVQFRDLTQHQISKLDYFTHNHTVGEA
ncbi:MAG: PilZ domain-containing protein [Deltaproteobacteria bacterium]|nr:PilZ domain-containing protein [Deltaproteobacteria bacterium]